MASRIAFGVLASLALTACTLLVPVDGLSTNEDGGSARGTTEAGGGADAAIDTGVDDASAKRSYRDEVLADMPVGYWRLGEASGLLANNEVAGGSPGSYQQTVTQTVAGAIHGDGDTAISLDAAGYVDLGTGFAFTGTQAFTLEIWVKPQTSDGEFRSLFGHFSLTTPGREGYAIWLEQPQGLAFERDRDDPTIHSDACYSAPGLPLGVYSHVVGVFDGAKLHLYVDGTEVVSSPSLLQMTPDDARLIAGAGTALSWFRGALDEAAVYDHALSPARIARHHAVGVGP